MGEYENLDANRAAAVVEDDADDKGIRRPIVALSLAALGVVYGDIGTSPLYAPKQCFNGLHGIAARPENVLGVVSMIVWSLVVIVSIKYLAFILQADNKGKGEIIALVALLNPWRAASGTQRHVLMIMGLFGAALLYGDDTITPAISVLSAVDGLTPDTTAFDSLVVPFAVVILIALFAIQRQGTSRIGALFGPIMLGWFATLAVLGTLGIVAHRAVFAALNPEHAAHLLFDNGLVGFIILGTVFLAVTGAETLYADMGHFEKQPIRLAWFVVVLPSLLLNYFEQEALILANPAAVAHPFYGLAPAWVHYPLVVLATGATVIASQAVASRMAWPRPSVAGAMIGLLLCLCHSGFALGKDGDDEEDAALAKPAPPNLYLDMRTSYSTLPAGAFSIGFSPPPLLSTLSNLSSLATLTSPSSRSAAIDLPLTVDISDRLSVYGGVSGSASQSGTASWTEFAVTSFTLGLQADIYQQNGGTFPTITVQSNLTRSVPASPLATTTYNTILEAGYALDPDETRGLLAGMQYIKVQVDTPFAEVKL